jgi:tRNA pseudouridine65 synthase
MTESQNTLPEIPILYRDEHLIVVHKPSGLLMHRSPISQDTVFLLQTLRDQIGQRVYPVHRLDRATSGVLLLGLNPDIARELVTQFESH